MGDLTGPRRVEGLLVAGTAVVLSGPWAECALQAALIAIRTRRANGLPPSPSYQLLAAALASANGHGDVREPVVGQDRPLEPPTVPSGEAAARLGLSERQLRRLAPQLGGRKIGGRWFVDERTLTDFIEWRTQWADD